MMRTSFRPLANLVDAAALKWLAVENADPQEQQRVSREITAEFRIGDKPELTFHGLKYLLTIFRCTESAEGACEYRVEAHEIVEG